MKKKKRVIGDVPFRCPPSVSQKTGWGGVIRHKSLEFTLPRVYFNFTSSQPSCFYLYIVSLSLSLSLPPTYLLPLLPPFLFLLPFQKT